ncbi:MAG: type III pantothenate kinase [Polyangia bacterium]
MLLVVDVGNTNTVLGVYQLASDGEGAGAPTTLRASWRIETRKGRTSDEYAATLRELMGMAGLTWPGITAGILATVVPPVLFALEGLFKHHLGVTPLQVGPGLKTGMPILYENPREVGADRIVNAVAAYERYKQGCIIVDFGTATTFDLVTQKGEYVGGAIAPGITTSADALYEAAAKLPRVEIARPASVVGRNTVASMQAGLYYGYVGLVDEIVSRMLKQADGPCRVVATGGLAPLIAKDSRTIEEADEMLTLEGLKLLYSRNRGT